MAQRNSTPYYCNDCEHVAPSLASARRHAKEAGPVVKGDRMVTHGLTRVAPVN